MRLIRKPLLFALPFAFFAVWATMFGPLPISSIGRQYASTTFADDASAEFEGANKVASVYLAKILNTPAKIVKANREDSIRITYFDGQIAEFKISRYPSSNSLDFTTKLSSANQQTRPRYINVDSKENCFGDSRTPVTVQTGYIGSRTEFDEVTGAVTIIGTWISTGTFTYFPGGSSGPYPKRCP